jgi:LuxR family transcriptional regulator
MYLFDYGNQFGLESNIYQVRESTTEDEYYFYEAEEEVVHPRIRMSFIKGASNHLFRGIESVVRDLGFDQCWYSIGMPVKPGRRMMVIMGNFSKSWLEAYRRSEVIDEDPFIRRAQRLNPVPMIWSCDEFSDGGLDKYSRWARANELNFGWMQPFRHGAGVFGMVNFARAEKRLSTGEMWEKMPKMQWLALVTHSLLFRVLCTKLPSAKGATLTMRETEFLRMAAEGKTSQEMADFMGVTERTANHHISNAVIKLGAMNRIHAVALAVRAGFLEG